MLTKGMCADLGPSGIQVNAIGPGYFATELTAALTADHAFRPMGTAGGPDRAPDLLVQPRIGLRQRPGCLRRRRHAGGAVTGTAAHLRGAGAADID
jgi:NAD(P)-dependent dehydrogenase (short-subunit alcohol dehydrogenase family)